MIKYPYSDFHEMNLNWMLEKVKELDTKVNDLSGGIDASKIHVSELITPDNSALRKLSNPYLGYAILVTDAGPLGIWSVFANFDRWQAARALPVSNITPEEWFAVSVLRNTDTGEFTIRCEQGELLETENRTKIILVDLVGTSENVNNWE